jgi:cytolysin-activating lysine-acyltransferase
MSEMAIKTNEIEFIAPRYVQQEWTEAEVLGSTVWLWMNSPNHNELPLNALSVALLPAIKQRQFILASQAGRPIFFVSWAMLSLEAELRYLETHQLLMTPEDWQSGDRMWFIDWVAPFGHTQEVFEILRRNFLKDVFARSLYHRASERGRRIQHFFGHSVPISERRAMRKNIAAPLQIV